MAGMPTRVLNLPNAATDNSETPATAFAGTGLGAGLNQLIDDAKGTGLKVGSGTSSPSAGKVLRATGVADADGNQQSAWGPVQAGDIAAGAAMKQLAKTTLGVDTATVSFTSISNAYSSLMIQVQVRSSTAAALDNLLLRVGNGSADTGANYDYQYMLGNVSAASIAENFAQTSILAANIPANTATANRAAVCTIHIPNYAGTTWTKELTTLYGNHYNTTSGSSYVGAISAQWRSASAIDTVTFLCAGNFKAGSVFILWGLP